jgi:hypothetical protein
LTVGVDNETMVSNDYKPEENKFSGNYRDESSQADIAQLVERLICISTKAVYARFAVSHSVAMLVFGRFE